MPATCASAMICMDFSRASSSTTCVVTNRLPGMPLNQLQLPSPFARPSIFHGLPHTVIHRIQVEQQSNPLSLFLFICCLSQPRRFGQQQAFQFQVFSSSLHNVSFFTPCFSKLQTQAESADSVPQFSVPPHWHSKPKPRRTHRPAADFLLPEVPVRHTISE